MDGDFTFLLPEGHTGAAFGSDSRGHPD
jgi:hypothetical protein